MEFWSQLYQKGVEFIFLGLVAFGGIKLGIQMRKSKNAKEAQLSTAQSGSAEMK